MEHYQIQWKMTIILEGGLKYTVIILSLLTSNFAHYFTPSYLCHILLWHCFKWFLWRTLLHCRLDGNLPFNGDQTEQFLVVLFQRDRLSHYFNSMTGILYWMLLDRNQCQIIRNLLVSDCNIKSLFSDIPENITWYITEIIFCELEMTLSGPIT